MSDEAYEANVRIRDLPRSTDKILSLLAEAKNKPKWEIIKEALVEYADNHKGEIMEAVNGTEAN